jgi:signal transduction histidine kinase
MLGPVTDLLAKSETGLSPVAKAHLELVNRNGLRLLRLVNTLLDFSRIERPVNQRANDMPDFGPAFAPRPAKDLVGMLRPRHWTIRIVVELDCRTNRRPS